MDLKSDANCKTEILDIIKSLKANGSFDQFRKDCFAEILTQQTFQNLKKTVEEFVVNYLNDLKPNSQTKKTVLRDNVRRLLLENSFMTDGINVIIDEIVNPKLEKTFINKIESMVNNEPKCSNETPINTHVTNNNSLNSSSSNIINQQEPKTSVKKVISVEDFIPATENKSGNNQSSTIKIETKKAITSQKQIQSHTQNQQQQPKPTAKPKSVEQRLSLSNNKKDFVRVKSSEASESSKSLNDGGNAKLKQPNSFNADEDDTDLETDPTNEYNFKWKLKNNLEEDLENLSVSSVNTTDLSELEYN